MSLRINFNAAAVQTHQKLKVADRMLTKSLERLSSGERINRSDDDPSGLVAANSIRHNLAGIMKSTSNIEEGVSMLQTADGAMDGISSLLVRLRSLALGAANEAVNDPAQLTAYQADFDEAVKSISRIADQARFGNIPLLQGNLSTITPSTSAKEFYSDLRWDATKLPGGLKAGTAVTVAPPVQNRTQVSAKFYGNPPATATLQGQNQNGTQLDNVGGNVTVTGPLAAQTYVMTSTTTIGEFVAMVNQDSLTTGARARYDVTTGELTVASIGPGTLNVRSADFTLNAATNVGLLDSSTAAATNPLVAATGDLQRERFEVVMSTAGTATAPFPTRATQLNGLFQSGNALTVVGGEQIQISGLKGSTTLTLTAGMTIGDFVDRVNLQTPLTGVLANYDSSSGSLALESTSFGSGLLSVAAPDMTAGVTTLGLFDLDSTSAAANPLHSPRDTFSAAFTTSTGGVAVAGDPLYGLRQGGSAPFSAVNDKQFTIYGRGLSATMDLEAPTDVVSAASFLATQMAASTPVSTWTPGVGAGTGTLNLAGNNLAVNTATTWYDLAAFANSVPVNTLTATTVTVGGGSMSLAGTFTGSLALEGTTVQDVVNFVNSQNSTLGTSAAFAAGNLSITGDRTPIHVSGDDLTGTDVGLMDFKASDPEAVTDGITNPHTIPSWNSTVGLTYTDALGTTRTLTLTQIPSADGGLAFTNQSSGPESSEPYTRWEAGAFTVVAKDSSNGAVGGLARTSATAQTGQRESAIWIQTGGFAGQRVNIEIPDMRAGALGRSALWKELQDPTSTRPLATKGYDSLDDLVSRQALIKGDAQLVIGVVDAAIDEVTNARGTAGALQANSLEATLASLRTAMENLTDSESRIRDTDFAEESATMARNNILYQAATAMLAQANQVPQTVLQLLK